MSRGLRQFVRIIFKTFAAGAEKGGGVAFNPSGIGTLGQRIDLFDGQHGKVEDLAAASADEMVMI